MFIFFDPFQKPLLGSVHSFCPNSLVVSLHSSVVVHWLHLKDIFPALMMLKRIEFGNKLKFADPLNSQVE